MDPLAEKYPSLSPYNYVMNNPLINFDPDGKAIYRFGVGYITGNEAKDVTLQIMISALKGEKSQIDFVGKTHAWEDLKDMLRGGTYSNDWPNPKGVSFGNNLKGNEELKNLRFEEFYVQTTFADQDLNSVPTVNYLGQTTKNQDLVQLIFTTNTKSGSGANDAIIYTNTVDNIQNILKKAGKKLVKYYYTVKYTNTKTGETWEEEKYRYRIKDIEN